MDHQIQLKQLFEKWAIEDVISIKPLPKSGSARKYYRITSKTKSVIGTYSPEEKENVAFVTFSRYFKRYNLNVPEVYTYDASRNIYLQEDLGDLSLYSFIKTIRLDEEFPDEGKLVYKKVIEQLPKFQVVAGNYFDYSACYPRATFDRLSMMWDLNYFKYYFLKLAKVNFDEQRLEDDFNVLVDFLLQADSIFFLYRDFQSRNIIVHNSDVYFIDYQGGRKGALQYDLASLLYEAKADLPESLRAELLDYYFQVVQQHTKINKTHFLKYFYGYALLRIFQAMGAYGYRGFYEKKELFLTSIPYAIKNLQLITDHKPLNVDLPELRKVITQIIYTPELKRYQADENESGGLRIKIFSFSYFDRMPEDLSGNGGGFIFDCRSLHNPGRYDQYKNLTGMDHEVKQFLNNEKPVQEFLLHIYSVIDEVVLNYIARGFTNLMVSFGCTGGQHRSVYSAEQLANHLVGKYKIPIEVHHTKLRIDKKFNQPALL
jgi:aminoglycoside/choline kinase family phosphotransferase